MKLLHIPFILCALFSAYSSIVTHNYHETPAEYRRVYGDDEVLGNEQKSFTDDVMHTIEIIVAQLLEIEKETDAHSKQKISAICFMLGELSEQLFVRLSNVDQFTVTRGRTVPYKSKEIVTQPAADQKNSYLEWCKYVYRKVRALANG